jgi:soluble lytic murein transglycosylase-like protein
MKYAGLIIYNAVKYRIPPALIAAVIRVESNFNPKASRYEPHLNDSSTGLMQILLKTAQGMDPAATAAKLYDPAYNINLGSRFLKDKLRAYPFTAAIAAYNSGTPRYKGSGVFINQAYVNTVLKYYKLYSLTCWAIFTGLFTAGVLLVSK